MKIVIPSLIVFSFLSLTSVFADSNKDLSYNEMVNSWVKQREKMVEAPKVKELSGTWILLSRQSMTTNYKISSFPDGSDSDGLKNGDGSFSILSFFSITDPSCKTNPFGFKLESWGTKDNLIENKMSCLGEYFIPLYKYYYDFGCSGKKCVNAIGEKKITIPENVFPFAPPMNVNCKLLVSKIELEKSHDRLVCAVFLEGTKASDPPTGALLFERKTD